MRRFSTSGIGVVAGAALVLVLSSCSGGSARVQAAGSIESMAPITLTYTSMSSGQSAGAGAFRAFAKEIEERTSGKVTITEYFSGSLLPGNETLEGIGSGVADAGFVLPSYYPQKLPVSNWIMDMGSLPSSAFPHGMLSGSAAAMALQREEALAQEWAAHNVRIINVSQPGAGNALLCTKPIDSAEQARGMRVFSGGGVWNAEVEALGMVPVNVAAPEAYEALQRGVIDCATAAPSTMVSFDWWDVAKHYIPVRMSAFNASAQVINLDVWNSLPPDAQAVITQAAHTWWTGINTGTLASYAGFAVDGPSGHGVVVHDPAPLDAVLEQHQATAVAALSATAPPTVADPQGLIDTYRSLLDEWMTRATETLGVPPPPRDPAAIQQSYVSGSDLDFSRFDEVTADELFPRVPAGPQ